MSLSEQGRLIGLEILSASPDGQIVLECRLPAGAVIAKLYPDGAGLRSHDAARALRRVIAAEGGSPPLAIPKPLWCAASGRVTLQERAPGISYREVVEWPGGRRHLRLAGQALALLHAQQAPDGVPKCLADHVAELMRPHPAELREDLPRHGSLVTALLELMLQRERDLPAIDPAPLHRDFHLGQLFYDGRRAWLIDWDLFARGDPALDVGNFSVYLQTRVEGDVSVARNAFLDGYFSAAPTNILERLPLFEAFTYLRLACKRYRLRRAGWRREVAELLGRSEAALTLPTRACDATDRLLGRADLPRPRVGDRGPT